MFNRNVSITCVGLGVFANLFVGLAGKALAAPTAEMFTVLGGFATAVGVLVFILSGKTKTDEDSERADIHRDIDAVYRHIDDVRRDLVEEIRECKRNSSHSATECRGKR